MAEWITPKTNWVANDYINIEDFNRIRNNILFLSEMASDLYKDFIFTTVLPQEVNYTSYAYSDYWNLLEEGLQEIVNKTYTLPNIGMFKIYASYDPYIDYEELNRLESVSLLYYQMFLGIKNTRTVLPFTLGEYKEMKI